MGENEILSWGLLTEWVTLHALTRTTSNKRRLLCLETTAIHNTLHIAYLTPSSDSPPTPPTQASFWAKSIITQDLHLGSGNTTASVFEANYRKPKIWWKTWDSYRCASRNYPDIEEESDPQFLPIFEPQHWHYQQHFSHHSEEMSALTNLVTWTLE